MGAWNSYDDGNDNVHDIIAQIEENILPKSIKDLPLYREKACTPARKNCKVIYDDEITLQNKKTRKEWITYPKRD